MRTIAQRRRRARIIWTGIAALLAIVVFTPKFDPPKLPFPFVTEAFAGQAK